MLVRRPGGVRLVVAALMMVGLIAGRADADPMYTAVTRLPNAVNGLNDSGQLITSNGAPTVYDGYGSWAGETRQSIPGPSDGFYGGGQGTYSAINNAGQVASGAVIDPYTNPSNPVWHAVMYNGQTTTDLGTLGGQDSAAAGINDAGQVVGYSDTASGTTHAFIAAGGKMTDLGTLPGGLSSAAVAINDASQAVGYAQVGTGGNPHLGLGLGYPNGLLFNPGMTAHAVLYQNGQVTDLGTLGGASSAAVAINQSGAIVGTSETSSGAQHAFLYQNGQMQDLGVLNSDWAHSYWGVAYSQAKAINNAGEIVGESNGLAFLDVNGKMYNLNDLVKIPGVTLESAFAINNAGQILARGYNPNDTSSPYPYLDTTTYLLNPAGMRPPEYAYAAPEPSTLLLMGGLASWLAVRRARGASRR